MQSRKIYRSLISLLIAGTVVALSAPVQAQECVPFPMAVQIRCQVELLGSNGITKKLEAWTPKARLAIEAAGKRANVTFGDYTVSAGLVCMGGSSLQPDTQMSYTFDVKLTQKGRPYASPLHLAMLRNLQLNERQGRKPLTLTSFYFFDKPLMLADVAFTRVDYLCSVETTNP